MSLNSTSHSQINFYFHSFLLGFYHVPSFGTYSLSPSSALNFLCIFMYLVVWVCFAALEKWSYFKIFLGVLAAQSS